MSASSVQRPTLDVERKLWRDGHRWVAGIDEVGRGAWAGPLSVGVAVVHAGVRSSSMPAWLRDSKSIPEERREGAFTEVAGWLADAAVGHASAAECDRLGMTLAWRLAARRALCALEVVPDAVLIDGPHDLLRGPRASSGMVPRAAAATPVPPGEPDVAPSGRLHASPDGEPDALPGGPDAAWVPGTPADFELPGADVPSTVLTVVGGDARCAVLSAASVLAKVVRDRLMREDAVHFPPYGFERNKGYPSPLHQMALRGYGLSAIHRRTWAYVGDLPWR